jgi:uncharacterized SAM-binding protein YcdF (DUF218 family)
MTTTDHRTLFEIQEEARERKVIEMREYLQAHGVPADDLTDEEVLVEMTQNNFYCIQIRR